MATPVQPVRLIFVTGPLAAQRYSVETEVTLGRDPSNAIVIPDATVSLVHCKIQFDGGWPYLVDLGSTNGTRVNGNRIALCRLRDGDGVTIGQSAVRVEIPGGGAKPALPLSHESGETLVLPTEDEAHPRRDREELPDTIFGFVTYYLKRKIAAGGMAAIYEADQFGAEGFVKRVAIKTILPALVRKRSFVTSFIGEARLAANLVHPNIVQIHHFGRHEEGYYIAMEYIDGVDLHRFLRAHRRAKRPVALDVALMIMHGVACGLAYAHQLCDEEGRPLHLVHRDVSPSNVMISRKGEVKLTDFGVALARRFMEDDDVYLVGSAEYMSPEQAACGPVDARSDVYSLGLVGYELLTGVCVFREPGDDPERIVERVRSGEVPDPRSHRPDLREDIVTGLMRCLQKDPRERWASAQELAHHLESCLLSVGTLPRPSRLAEYLRGIPGLLS